MKKIILLTLLLTGCSTHTQTLVLPNGKCYKANISNDTVVVLKTAAVEISFDRRGKPGILENLLMFMGLKIVDTKPREIK